MKKAGDFTVQDDGLNLTATISVHSSLAANIFLYTLNILLIAVIVLFTIGGIGVIVLFIVAFEVLFLRYSIWNLHGSETIVLNKHELMYQQHYGPIKLPVKKRLIHKSIRVIPFLDDFQGKGETMKLIFESFDESNEPVNLYQTALTISKSDYQLFMKSFNRRLNPNSEEYLLPVNRLN